jgi:alkanesulfonate monooxygenase SsuD/methylene tetrahydromethanopterin reductase-like flavin-dependent oxidoreductase (luciferase family)
VWPKPLEQPLPPMYALGTSREASDFAARNHIKGKMTAGWRANGCEGQGTSG